MTEFTVKSKRTVVATTGSRPPAAGNRPYEFTSDELATRLEWDFQGPKPRFINPFGAAAPNRIEVIDGGLKLVRGAKAPENGTFCGFLWNTDVSGDFEATINFRDFESQTDTDDWQAPRIELQFDIGGGWSDSTNTHVIQTGLRRRADKKPGLFVGNRIRKGEDFDWKHSHRETQESAGSFRLVRKGEVAWCLHSKDGEGDWTIIYEGPIGNAPLKGGNFGLRTEIPKSSGEVIVTGFILKTREPPR